MASLFLSLSLKERLPCLLLLPVKVKALSLSSGVNVFSAFPDLCFSYNILQNAKLRRVAVCMIRYVHDTHSQQFRNRIALTPFFYDKKPSKLAKFLSVYDQFIIKNSFLFISLKLDARFSFLAIHFII